MLTDHEITWILRVQNARRIDRPKLEELRADLRTTLRQYRNLMHEEFGVSREDSPARRMPWYREMIDRHGFEGEIDRDLIDGKYFF